MPKLVWAFAGNAFANGGAHCTDEYAGVALWLPPGVRPDEEKLAKALPSTVSPSVCSEVFAIFDQMSKHHPSEPRWHLPLIGVDPAFQNRGQGDALMQYALQ